MFYTAETGRQHATTFFNRTIDIVEPHTWVDFQAIFLVVLILAGIGGLGVLPPTSFCHLSCLHSLLSHAQQPPAKLQAVGRVPAFPAQATKWKRPASWQNSPAKGS